MARSKTQKRALKQVKNHQKRVLFAYPLIIFLLLCAGAYLLASTLRAAADDIHVTAKVSAPFVTDPAVITTPAGGEHFTGIPIDVSGTCPANAGYVEIFGNNLMRGTAPCTGGAFDLSVDLFPGQNDLVAHVFNTTDDEGPVSNTVTVYYDVPQSPASNPAPNGSGQAGQGKAAQPPPLVLKTAFIYKGFYTGQPVEWPLQISGGIAPYAISVDWGDGKTSVISLTKTGQFNIDHIYNNPGPDNGDYAIKVSAADASRQQAFIQFFVVVNARQNASATGNIFSKPTPTLPGGHSWLWIAWPAYGVIFVMVLSYWLGEKEELVLLRKRGVLKKRARA